MLRCLPLALLVPALAFGQDGPTPVKPLARGKDHLLHALPVRTGGWVVFGPPGGLVLVHTRTDTGVMSRLLQTGSVVTIIPMGIDSVTRSESRLVGVTVDEQRIYAVVWSDGPGAAKAHALHIFRRSDGKALPTQAFAKGDFPSVPLPETTASGPLALVPDGVRCFGVTFTFAGDKLKAARYEKAAGSKER